MNTRYSSVVTQFTNRNSTNDIALADACEGVADPLIGGWCLAVLMRCSASADWVLSGGSRRLVGGDFLTAPGKTMNDELDNHTPRLLRRIDQKIDKLGLQLDDLQNSLHRLEADLGAVRGTVAALLHDTSVAMSAKP